MSSNMKLNIGCGRKIKEGYINIDIRKTNPKVVVADIRKLPYPNNSIDEIYANDSYEHVKFSESLDLLIHWVSKLKPGGILKLQTTDASGLARVMLKQTSVKGIEAIIRKTFGGQDYKFNFHFTAGHPVLMEHYLKKAGIKGKITITSKGTNMKVEAIK